MERINVETTSPPRRASSPTTMSPLSAQAPTNTLILTNLPLECFSIAWLTTLRKVFESHGEIHTWTPLKVFRRAIVIFWRPEDAESAKRQLDGLILPSDPPAQIRVYRTENTPSSVLCPDLTIDPNCPDPYHLAPPKIEKNFLISPPGSPPVGWEPVKEDPPNPSPLAADLISALTKLQIQQSRRRSSTEILFDPSDATEGVGIMVYVEDCDSDGEMASSSDDDDWERRRIHEASNRFRIAPTSLPPLQT